MTRGHRTANPAYAERMRRTLPWTVAAAIAGFSIVAVYCTFVSVHTIDAGTGAIAAVESLKLYHQALDGVREFPYQWRLLGVYLVYGSERLTGLDPHVLDAAWKAVLLFASSVLLFLFARRRLSGAGAFGAVALYQLLTVAGFTEPYSIYFTSDYAMVACWFAAVWFVERDDYLAAAAATFVGAWAKETMLLVPVFVGLRWLRGRAGFGAVALVAAAFLLPTVVLRTIYRAPVSSWAWWHMLFVNVPGLQPNLHEVAVTLKNNLKVALFYNVFWILAAGEALRSRDPFTKDLAVTGVVYLVLAYPVIYIRELRHFLPLAIIVLPLALQAVERQLAPAPEPDRAPQPR